MKNYFINTTNATKLPLLYSRAYLLVQYQSMSTPYSAVNTAEIIVLYSKQLSATSLALLLAPITSPALFERNFFFLETFSKSYGLSSPKIAVNTHETNPF